MLRNERKDHFSGNILLIVPPWKPVVKQDGRLLGLEKPLDDDQAPMDLQDGKRTA